MNKTLLTVLLTLLISPATLAEFSRDFIDSHGIQKTAVGEISIAYRVIGEGDNRPKVVTIMGLGGAGAAWGDNMMAGLKDAGYEILLIDNRDTGESSRFDAWGQPTLWWQLLKYQLGFSVTAPYSIDDMAADLVAVMDKRGYTDAHIIGVSMGGMIAQVVAAQYPERTTSLTSIMSSTFAPHLPPPTADAESGLRNLATGDAKEDREAAVRHRGFYPESMQRHLMAIFKAGDRSSEVMEITAPTLVIHGSEDPLVPPPHGEHTAELIDDSRFILIEGMAHNIPDDKVPEILGYLSEHIDAIENNTSTIAKRES